MPAPAGFVLWQLATEGYAEGVAGRGVAKAHRETINRKGHFRRTKTGALKWVEPHQVLAHIAEHGPEPDATGSTVESVRMGIQAMGECFKGHNVVHAMYRRGLGWVDFEQGISDGEAERLSRETGRTVKPYGIRHIWEKRNAEHRQDSTKPDGKTVLRLLPGAIAKGQVVSGGRDAAVLGLEYNGVRVFLSKNEQGRWLLTGYKR